MDSIAGREDCYTSSLVITGLASDDMRSYKLTVENIHGTDTLDISLIIQGGFHQILDSGFWIQSLILDSGESYSGFWFLDIVYFQYNITMLYL